MAPAAVALALAGLWCLAEWLPRQNHGPGWAGLGAGGATALFVWLRDWLKKPVEETQGSRLLTRALRWIRPILPQVAALVAVALFFLGVAILVKAHSSSWLLPALAGGLCLSALAWFDPAAIGLHEFYRGCIARCFLGASLAQHPGEGQPVPSPATSPQDTDDLSLSDIRKQARKPLHLVCCAANNLKGDPLGSLYRGARSSVLSPFGLTLGNFCAPRDELKFSSALTASAAAFNSQMGAVSMKLGPAVAFLMCALNLRLGLWLPHPLNPTQRSRIPAMYFLFEALGRSRSDQVWDLDLFKGFMAGAMSHVHLSDGGHFENLGLYELIRRHCRHVIVSDATADTTSAFDDLANAVRRVREDFGVEIEIDVNGLRPGDDGYAKQHMAIGTIHYDGLDGTDKGSLIYLKPVLTGDEPVDVLQFRVRNPHFPHDGTADQFYDEAQWESYRRLGQHTAALLVGIADEDLHPGSYVDKLFTVASQRLQVVDRTLDESFLRLTERCNSLVEDLCANAPATLRREFFPEITIAKGLTAKPNEEPSDPLVIAHYMMLITQLMEDVWLEAGLDERWAHPLNHGWMNYFHRWAATPSFRTWWPILRPIYNPAFRDFVKDRFKLQVNERAREQDGPGAKLNLREFDASTDEQGLAYTQWLRLHPHRRVKAHLAYDLQLQDAATGKYLEPVQVGVLFCDFIDGQCTWKSEDMFVCAALNGSGIPSRFLDAVVHKLGKGSSLAVEVDNTDAGLGRTPALSRATRTELVQRINTYKSRGFHYTTKTGSNATTTSLLVREPG